MPRLVVMALSIAILVSAAPPLEQSGILFPMRHLDTVHATQTGSDGTNWHAESALAEPGSGTERPAAPIRAATDIDAEAAPEFVVILSNPRSGSTGLSISLANASCAVSFNEWFSQVAQQTIGFERSDQGYRELQSVLDIMWPVPHEYICKYLKGGCGGHLFATRREKIGSALKQARSGFCHRTKHTSYSETQTQVTPLPAKEAQTPEPFCGGACTVVIKIHADMVSSADGLHSERRNSLAYLLGQSGVKAIVSERKDVAAQECSYKYSKATGIWHSGSLWGKDKDPKKKAWEKAHCNKKASHDFKEANREWFEWVRDTLQKKGTPTLEMSVEQYAADPEKADREIHAFAYGRAPPHHGENMHALRAAVGDD